MALLGFPAWLTIITLSQLVFISIKGSYRIESIESGIAELVITTAFALICYKLLQGTWSFARIGLKPGSRSVADFLIGLVYGATGVAVALAVISIYGGIHIENGPPPEMKDATMGPITWSGAAVMFSVYALNEEVFSRGFLYPMIKKSVGIFWGLVLSSLTFSLLHYLNPQFTTMAAIDIFLAGVFLALLREITGDLYLAWGAHLGWNIGLVYVGVPVSGFVVQLAPQAWHLTADGPSWLTGSTFGPEGGIAGIIADVFMVGVGIVWLTLKRRREMAKIDGGGHNDSIKSYDYH